jgi:N-acetylglucosaminyl-diphospho-decaprenol L-rhamnosyltransferase
MSATPRVAVVIVSFEARETLLAALDSLRAHVSRPIETIVVDNASTDGSAEAIRAAHPEVVVIDNGKNVGFARACNQGWRASQTPYVLFLNPDAEVTPGAVDTLARLLESRPEAGAAGPRTRNADGSIQVSTGPDLTPLAERRQRRLVRGVARREPVALAEAEALHAREHEPAWVSGSCLMTRRAALEGVGGFDERFFLYEEDADLCRRMRAAGWRIVFTPAAEVRHALGRSMAEAPLRSRLEYHRSHLLYYHKHNGPVALAALRLLLAARGLGGWLRGRASGDTAARADGLALVRLALERV